MAQLTFTTIPGFVDIADSAIAADQPLTDDSIQKLSHNAKFAAVRTEIIFMGFFRGGDTVPTPVSPVDGYGYAYAECAFIPIFASGRSPAGGFVVGQKTFPGLAASDAGVGALLLSPQTLDINDTTGLVACTLYWATSGAETAGTVKVYCIAVRSSVNTAN
jgi:hypothetical protein